MIDYTIPSIASPLLDEQDPVFSEAVELVKRTGKASASLFQRHLDLGYARAARLLDQLESAGVVGPGQGARPREILIPHDNADDETYVRRELPAKQPIPHNVDPLPWTRTSHAKGNDAGLNVDIGTDENGKPVSLDLERYGSLLIIGSQYTGALDFLNGALALTSAAFSPEQLRVVAIDPMRELIVPRRSPHLLVPLVWDQNRINSALAWLQTEIQRRRAGDDLVAHPAILLVLNSLNLVLDNALDEARLYSILLAGRKAGVFVLATIDLPGSGAPKRVLANLPARLVFKPTDSKTARDTGIPETSKLQSPDEAILETMYEGRTKVTITKPHPKQIYEQILS